ncbi:unnamed protein product, partial [Prorocentrum cordatum]
VAPLPAQRPPTGPAAGGHDAPAGASRAGGQGHAALRGAAEAPKAEPLARPAGHAAEPLVEAPATATTSRTTTSHPATTTTAANITGQSAMGTEGEHESHVKPVNMKNAGQASDVADVEVEEDLKQRMVALGKESLDTIKQIKKQGDLARHLPLHIAAPGDVDSSEKISVAGEDLRATVPSFVLGAGCWLLLPPPVDGAVRVGDGADGNDLNAKAADAEFYAAVEEQRQAWLDIRCAAQPFVRLRDRVDCALGAQELEAVFVRETEEFGLASMSFDF